MNINNIFKNKIYFCAFFKIKTDFDFLKTIDVVNFCVGSVN